MKNVIVISALTVFVMSSFTNSDIPTDRKEKNPVVDTTTDRQESTPVEIVNHFFDKFKSGASPAELASLFDEKAEMFIPGDTKNVPWIGKRVGRAKITEHFKLLREYIKPEKLEFIDILNKGNRVVILGYLESQMKRNGNIMKSEFSIDIVVENGLITRYHLLEDSFEVSGAAK